MNDREVMSIECAVKGFLTGSLFASAALSGLGPIIQPALFAIALLAFVDSILLFGRDAHILTTVFFNVLGISASLLFLSLRMLSHYTAFTIIILAMVYLRRFSTAMRT